MSSSDNEASFPSGVREIMLNLPEDEGEGLGFRLTRTLWDPYPWVREVTPGSRASAAGLRPGDCLLQADGTDLLGLPVSQVARLIRGDGAGRGVPLTAWNCGVDPTEDPELLWSCGGGTVGERSRRALSGAVRALACGVCAATATTPLCCARGHLYCLACWTRLEKCALCREPLPAKESPYARNLVAEQVFEAIATEYEIKNVKKRPTETLSAYTSPNISPSSQRRGQYQLSIMRKKVQFNEKYRPTYASDPNIHRSTNTSGISNIVQNSQKSLVNTNVPELRSPSQNTSEKNCIRIQQFENSNSNPVENSSSVDNLSAKCNCQCQKLPQCTNALSINTPTINIEKAEDVVLQHKLVARLRQSCSLADLQNSIQNCQLSKSLNNLGDHCPHGHHSSLDNLKGQCKSTCDIPVFLLTGPPIYLLACDHNEVSS